jgi:hypothetical protein
MNKKFLLVISIATVTLLSSCLTSLHNLVTYKTVANDSRITGNWQNRNMTFKIEPVPTSSFFQKMDSAKVNGEEKKSAYDSKEDSLLYSNSYIIDFIKNGYRYYMACCLTRIGDDLYADIQPLTAEPVKRSTAGDIDDMFSGGRYMTTHSIAKVIFHENDLQLRILNSDFIKDQLINGSAAIKYEKDDLFATTIITSSSSELRQFLSKYGNNERLYSPKNTITLTKM